MEEKITEHDEQLNKTKEMNNETSSIPANNVSATDIAVETPVKRKFKFTKKMIAILGVIVVAIVAIMFALLYESEFEKVQNECVQIAGMVEGSDDYFKIDTYPDEYKNMDESVVSILLRDAQKNALEAIRYANKELGFNDSLYSRMLETSALMGRQSEENDKYKVSWTYHPDDGLEVTYEKNK